MNLNVYYWLVLWPLVACNSDNPASKAKLIPVVKENHAQQDFEIFSEPASQKITVVFRSPMAGKAVLNLYYPDGKIFEQRQLAVNRGINTWDCYYKFKSAGMYLVSFAVDSIERRGKFFKSV